MRVLSVLGLASIASLQSFSQGSPKNGDVGKFLAEFRMIPESMHSDNSYINIRGGKFRICFQEITQDSLYLFRFRNQQNNDAKDNRAILFTRQELKNFKAAIAGIINKNNQKVGLTNCSVLNLASDSFNGIVVMIQDGWCLMSGKTTKRLLGAVENLSRINTNANSF